MAFRLEKALVTGFDPFGGEPINSSREAVIRLPARLDSLALVTEILPTSFARSLPVLAAAIARHRPDIVLCVGQARTRAALSLERIAINVQDARIPDNDGAQPTDVAVVAGGAAAYFATLPLKRAVAAMSAAGLVAEISNSAGTFVCNHLFYGLMDLARSGVFRAGVLHVPRLPEQTANEPGTPSMRLAHMVQGIVIVLDETARAVARARADEPV